MPDLMFGCVSGIESRTMIRDHSNFQARSRKASGPITPLLRYLAGEHAEQIEAIWPAPHEGFLTLPTARRHAAAILLAGLGGEAKLSADRLAHFIERQKDRVVSDLVVGPNLSAGFIKMLNKCGEVLWSAADYAELLSLFRAENSNLVLRHMDVISQTSLRPIMILPAPLRNAKVISCLPHLSATYDLADAFDLVGRIRGAAAQAASAHRWGKAVNRQSLFSMAAGDLLPETAVAYAPAPDLPAPFERVGSSKALRETALAFNNCLEDYAWAVAKGRMAVYVWRGDPNSAVALNWNVDGWRLAEAEAKSNTELEEGPLREIVGVLVAHNVRTGSSIEALSGRLSRLAQNYEVTAYEDDLRLKTFKERLDLGDLWQ